MRFVRNEWMKIWAQKSAWIMMGLVILAVVGLLGLNKYFSVDQSTPEQRLEQNEKDLALNQKYLDSPDTFEEDKYMYSEEILKIEYRIANDLPAAKAIMSTEMINILMTVILTLVGIFTMVTAASIVSNEFGTGTIKMLLTRPASRWKILLSKLIATLLYGLAIFAVSSLVAIIGSYLLFNSGEAFNLYVVEGQVVKEVIETNLLKMIVLNLASNFMTILFAFMLGTLFGSSTLAVSLSLIILFAGSIITVFLLDYDFTKFIWIANDLAQFTDESAVLIPDLTLGFAIVVNIVYAIIFLGVSFIYFMRRDVTA